MTSKVLLLDGDGIGTEVNAQAEKLLDRLRERHGLGVELESGLVGGAAYDATGTPLPDETLEKARASDAILLGAVGGPAWEQLPFEKRPERGLLGLRADLSLFANLRPAIAYEQLADASSLKSELVAGLDIMIVRELTGGIYFGKPRGIRKTDDGEREGFNTLVYRESEIRRIAHAAFKVARERSKQVCSVDKANVLECTEFWREVVTDVGKEYPDCELSHMYVDNAAMQLVRMPKQFDVVVTTNMFGDILSDIAAMLTGSIGMLPSASLDDRGKGMYEPVHGSAPDIAGTNKANPLAALLSVEMMLRYSLAQPELADRIGNAVKAVLDKGLRTIDLHRGEGTVVGTEEMGDAVINELDRG